MELASPYNGDEFQTPNFNILNNSLIQIYKTDNAPANPITTDSGDLAVGSPPSTTAPGTNGVMEGDLEGERRGEVPSLAELASSHHQHDESVGDASVPSDNVEPHPKPHPDPSNQSLERTEPVMPIPSVSMETTEECAESAPSDVARKKVSFSTPEVTSQRDYTIEEESRMRPVVKKKKSRRHESENPHPKRRKEEQQETATPSPQLKQTKTSSKFTKLIVFCVNTQN
jgi:hypothetical protein